MEKQGNQEANLIIRVMEREDLESARQLHNDNSTLMNLSDPEYISELQQEAWFDSISRSSKSKRFSIYEKSGKFVGLFRVDQIDLINKSACVGLDISAEMRGQGYAPLIYNYMMQYYFYQMGMNRLYLAVLDSNGIAKNLYQKLGFQVEGISRSAIFRNGKYIDLIWMSILSGEYFSLKKMKNTK